MLGQVSRTKTAAARRFYNETVTIIHLHHLSAGHRFNTAISAADAIASNRRVTAPGQA